LYKFKRLPEDIVTFIPRLEELKEDKRITALYLFGSAAEENLKPLSDIDIAVLLSRSIPKEKQLDVYLDISVKISELLETDEVDLLLMNSAPPHIIQELLSNKKLIFYNDKEELVSFIERNTMLYLDFKYYRDEFNRVFQEGMGIKR
jgi:uncharacterized protein